MLRVTNRLGLAHGEDPLKVEAQLMTLVPRERWTRTTDLLIFHGRKICDARRPACGVCPLFADLPLGEPSGLGGRPPAGGTPSERRLASPDGSRRDRRQSAARRTPASGATRPRTQAREQVSPSERALAAVVQMTSTADVERNLAAASALVEQAAARGAAFVGLPENFAFLRSEGEPVPEPQALDGPWVRRMAELARRLGITLLLGSLPERVPGDTRVHNTSVLLGPDGRTLAATARSTSSTSTCRAWSTSRNRRRSCRATRWSWPRPPSGRSASRSATTCASPSSTASSSRRGARVLCVPSAFTERTGKAHWEVLLRARAIENLAYVLAPAQVGHHGGGRSSHGHAMIVDPWGAVVAQVPDGEGVALAELDFDRQERLRRELPASAHARLPLPARLDRRGEMP